MGTNSEKRALASRSWKKIKSGIICNFHDISTTRYSVQVATKEQIFSHLERCDKYFIPILSEKVNIRDYAAKIYEKAVRFEAWDGERLTGLVAAYFNDAKKHSGFITNVSVEADQRGKGIATELLKNCIGYAGQHDFKEIRLEVDKNNFGAIQLYGKLGFEKKGSDQEMLTMRIKLPFTGNDKNT